MFRYLHRFSPLAALVLSTALSSCHIGPHGMDFSPITDRYTEVRNDEVILESRVGGSYPVPTPPALVAAAAPAAAAAPSVAPALTAPKPAPAATPAGGIYTVKAGDTLSGVARRHSTTAAAIAAANGIAPTAMLKIGQQLRLPAAGKAVAAAPAGKPAAKPQPAKAVAKAAAPTGKAGRHTVQAGETLYGVARRYKVSPAALMQANKLTPQTAGKLSVGTILTIPAK